MTYSEVPTVEEVSAVLGVEYPHADISSWYASEVAAQAEQCRVEPYNDQLAAALFRRIKRARAMSSLPLGVQTDELGAVRIGSTDPEVRRLEAPFRRMPVG